MLDFHNHLMPGVDDGAADIDEARSGLGEFRSQRVSDVITTPHVRASLLDRPQEMETFLAGLDSAWGALKDLATAEFPEMRVERGAEVMLDVAKPNLSEPKMRLGGTSFVLIEFPFMSIPPHSTPAIRNLVEAGWIPVIAHPERYRNMPGNHDLVEQWRGAGACIQATSGSLMGQYGAVAQDLVWELLRRGCVDYLCSDYHSRGKCSVSDAAGELEKRGGLSQLYALMTGNPERLLRNEMPEPVEPLDEEATSSWKRLIPWLAD